MALPSIATPEFKTVIPSTGESITYRPFLVKEEKILLMALEGGDVNEITNAIKKILKECVFEELNVDELATFDVEFLFLQLRGKSVGEVVDLSMSHTYETECKHRTDVAVKLDEINLTGLRETTNIMVTDKIGVKLRYPTLKDSVSIDQNMKETDMLFKIIAKCIEYVFDEESVYNEFTEKEIEDWVSTLNQSQFKKIVDFFQEMPKLEKKVEWTCTKCGEKDEIMLEGLQSFFT
jgi:hypothetical protein